MYVKKRLVLDPASVNLSFTLIVQLSWYQKVLNAFLNLSTFIAAPTVGQKKRGALQIHSSLIDHGSILWRRRSCTCCARDAFTCGIHSPEGISGTPAPQRAL